MQTDFYVQSAEYGKYYIEVDVNGYGTYNIWIGMLNSDDSVGNPVDELTTSNKSSARRKYNRFIQDAETDSYGWNYKVPDLSWKFDINTKLNSVQEYILSNPKNIKASSYIRRGSNMRKYVKASSDSSIRQQIRNTITEVLSDGPSGTTYWVNLDYDDSGNQWAVVFGWIDDGDGIPLFCGKVAYLPKNSGMSDYDYDWMMPYDEETGEVWDTEIEFTSADDSNIDWLLEQWEEIQQEYINRVDFYEDSDAEIDLLDDESETDDIWESTNIHGRKEVMSASSCRNTRKRGKQTIKSSIGATRITDLPDDTVIRVDEVLDYARRYMKPEDIDHHGNGRGMDDLYLRVNDVSKWIVNHMDNTAQVSKFVDNIDHVLWYELPFLYRD